MSRSIGDAVGAMVGVTAEPELMDTTLKTEDAFLVIASDGVWEFLESADVVRLLQAKLKGRPPTEETLLMVAQYIADKSRQEWLKEDKYVDDITVIVCLFQHRTAAAAAAARKAASPAASTSPAATTASPQRPSPSRANGAAAATPPSGGGPGRMSVTALGPAGKRGACRTTSSTRRRWGRRRST